MGLASFVARFLHHAEDAIVALDMIVGPLTMLPTEKDDHLLKFVFS
jgi:hypothetical protein